MAFPLASLWMPERQTLTLVAPELVLVTTLALLLIAPLLVGRHARLSGLIALLGAVAAALAAAGTLPALAGGARELFGVLRPGLAPAGPGMLVADRLGVFFRLFLMVFLLAVIAMWFLLDAARERHGPEFFTLLVASALGMALMASTINLLLMLIAIELASMPSFALAGFDRQRRSASEAAVKYAVFGAATSGFMVYGVSLLFGMFGTLHVPTLVQRIAAGQASGPLLAAALLALFAGIGFKISAVPFHFWCPDVFEGASLPIATWLSVASKAAGLLLLLRLVSLLAAPTAGAAGTPPAWPGYPGSFLPTVSYGVGSFGMLTCTVANLAAYRQSNVRRLLAYSSIAHAGYMLCAAAIVYRAGAVSAAAVSALAAYLMVYMFMNLGAFMSLGLLALDAGSERLEAFTGLGWRDAPIAASFTVCLISLIGLPPLGGFVVKWWLIYALGAAAHRHHAPLLWTLVIVIVLNTALSLFYYARVIRQMYLRGLGAPAARLRAPLLGKGLVHLCALVLLLTGTLLIPALKRNADRAARQMYAPGAAAGRVELARQTK